MLRWSLALLLVVSGCSGSQALDVAATAAKEIACVICGENVGAREQAAKHTDARREIAEAVAVVAAAVNASEVDRIREALRASEERERVLFDRLVEIAKSAKPAATVAP